MKKLLFLLLLLFGISAFGQSLDVGIQLPISKTYVDTVTVGTTPVQCPDHVDAQWVQFTTEDATHFFWFVNSDTSSSQARWGHIGQYDTTERYPIINTNVFWLEADAADVKVLMLWGE